MTVAERQRPYLERRKAKEQALRNKNVRLRRRVKRMTFKSSIETEERMPLINALRRAQPSVSLENNTQRAAAVVRRAIYVAILSEQNQQPVH